MQEIDDIRRLDRRVQQSTNMDFPEQILADKREPSVEDKLFMSNVSNTIHLVDGHYEIKYHSKMTKCTYQTTEFKLSRGYVDSRRGC